MWAWDCGPPQTWPGPAPRAWAPNNDHRPLLLPPTRVAARLPPLATPVALWGKSELARLRQEGLGKRITNARIFAASPESCAFSHTLVAPSLGPSWLSIAGLLEVWSFPVSKFRKKSLLNHPASHRANQKPQNLEKEGRGRKSEWPPLFR